MLGSATVDPLDLGLEGPTCTAAFGSLSGEIGSDLTHHDG